jgi:hypothetical protein
MNYYITNKVKARYVFFFQNNCKICGNILRIVEFAQRVIEKN